MTWPLLPHLATHIPGDQGDGPNFLWRLWWVSHAVFGLMTNPLETNLLFHPQEVSLVFDTLVPLYGILSAPVQGLFGQVVAYNVLVLVSFPLAASGAYRLAHALTRDAMASFLAGLIFGFSPYLLAHMWGHLNLLAAWPLPWFALFLLKTIATGRVRWAVAAGAMLGAVSLLEYQYSAFAVLWAAVACAYMLPQALRWWRPARCLGLIAVVAGVWLAVFSPLLLAGVGAYLAGITPFADPRYPMFYSGDLTGFMTPSVIRWGEIAAPQFASETFQGVGSIEGILYLGFTPVALAILGMYRGWGRQTWTLGPRFWAVCAAVFGVLALGPALHIEGQTELSIAGSSFHMPLPFAALQYVPFLGTTRVPARLVVVLYLALGVLAAYGFSALRRSWPLHPGLQAGALLAFATLTVFEYGVAPIQLRPIHVPAFYRTLAGVDLQGEGLLTLPVDAVAGATKGVGTDDQDMQLYQVVHGQPITNGHVSRGPASLIDFYLERPVMRWLINPLGQQVRQVDLNPDNFAQMVERLKVRYAVIHKQKYDGLTVELLRSYFADVFRQEMVWDDDEILVFELSRPRGPGDVAKFLSRLDAPVVLMSPPDRASASEEFPLLMWQPAGEVAALYQVQVSTDPWFKNAFLYDEIIDGRLTDPPYSYRIPRQYPLDPEGLYYWRVRPADPSAGETLWGVSRSFYAQ